MAHKKTGAARKPQVTDRGRGAIDAMKYNAVVEAAKLGRIILGECKFDLKTDYFKFRRLGKDDAKCLKFSYDGDVTDLHFDPEQNAVGANFGWRLVVKSGRTHVLKLYCSYMCFYTGLKDQDEAAAKAFAERVGKFATYPYFRAFASQISWASDTDLPLLPVLREIKASRSKASPRTTPRPDAGQSATAVNVRRRHRLLDLENGPAPRKKAGKKPGKKRPAKVAAK